MLLFLSEFLGRFVDSVVKVNVENVVTPHSAVFSARVSLNINGKLQGESLEHFVGHVI